MRRRLHLTIVALALAVCLGLLAATPTLAASAWWHITSRSQPTNLHAGDGRSEVQELAWSSGGAFVLEVGEAIVGTFETAPYPFGGLFTQATAANVQTALEAPAAYGAGNVAVTGGPGGLAPLIVTSINGGANRPVTPLKVPPGLGSGKAKVLTEGRSDAKIVVSAEDLGDQEINGTGVPVTIADKLPPGLEATAILGEAGFESNRPEVTCTQPAGPCTYAGTLPPYEQLKVEIAVNLSKSATSAEANEATISGGEAPDASVRERIAIGASTPFGIEDYELTPYNEDGSLDTQAGSHPFELTTTLALNRTGEKPYQPAMPKDLRFKLPPGLVGNPTPFPQCPDTEFFASFGGANECPSDTVVGVAAVNVLLKNTLATIPVPLFALKPAVGEPARFGFAVEGSPVILDTSVRTGGDYGVTVSVNNITQTVAFYSNVVTFWGVPGDPRHDQQRGWSCIDGELWAKHSLGKLPPCTAANQPHPPPLLTLPTSCTGPLHTTVEADSWPSSSDPTELVAPATAPVFTASLDGCNRLGFEPEIKVAPDVSAASAPTGLKVDLHVPQDESLVATGLAESDVKSTTVTLPEGVAVNPAGADGLLACTDVAEAERPEGEIALNSGAAVRCPDASKIGTVQVTTPLLPDPLEGSLYLAAQNENPFGSLLAIYLVAEDPTAGVLVKLAGEVKLSPTGQLVAKLEQPQLPFEDATLHFFGGDRAPLVTPASCGAYTTTTSIEPWSANPPATPSSRFDITTGPNGGSCQSPLPFAPQLTGGTTNIQAGSFSPFTMTMSRDDGNQDLRSLKLHMPPGLAAMLSGVTPCGEVQANAGTCGPESEIGETTVSVGLGGDPYSVKGGRVYLTGPYQGAPFGLSIVNPAKAGPFDLEKSEPCDCLVVRAKIEVDPNTADVTVSTEPEGKYAIPHIIDGIPLQIKHVNVTIDRPGFTFNPTDCNPLGLTGTLSSTGGASSTVSVPFQVTNCAALAFKPKFSVSTSGHTSRKNGASLDVKLTYPNTPQGTETNIAKAKVQLPKRLPSRLKTLQKACTEQVFAANPANCPSQSRVGMATAKSPLLPVTLSGPAYFVSHGGAKFPELVVVLQGDNVTIDLHGETFISKKGITTSTFATVPDVPVSSFELKLPAGPYSALAANGNLCKGKLTLPTEFVAHDGAVIRQNTRIAVTGCPKKVKHKAKNGGKRKK